MGTFDRNKSFICMKTRTIVKPTSAYQQRIYEENTRLYQPVPDAEFTEVSEAPKDEKLSVIIDKPEEPDKSKEKFTGFNSKKVNTVDDTPTNFYSNEDESTEA